MKYSIVKRPLDPAGFCGDAGVIKELDDGLFVAIIDALGHGQEAQIVAAACADFLDRNFNLPLTEMVTELHQHIRGSRGAVASLCKIDQQHSLISYVSIGDTLLRKINNSKERIVSVQGVIGYQIRSVHEKKLSLAPHDILILHSDGIASHFDIQDEFFFQKDCQEIATEIIEKYGKKHDDALCIVIKT